MSRNREFARQVESAVDGVSGRVRHYADEATGTASNLYERTRRISNKLAKKTNGNGQRARYLAEDFADEATYQYRRLRKQVRRHPATTIGIVAAALGTFLLIRHALRSNDD
ncbi:hypothetical protein EC912_10824 [Luteibacter rhizovicinus]|uniref:ElaB/YqjD/DUF883 family membrane-anchored ribosome-binding protein n=1 Tax=Luteibacter rhizovicinus TaxID=242606 RepID=A0A4R3YMH7_9GAMM|nr:hypothetical protein [Luteibacter rhizovicinus]TCV92033.1 hypothetical protein EC912_10824 [Luteibacter rhizovicinus]